MEGFKEGRAGQRAASRCRSPGAGMPPGPAVLSARSVQAAPGNPGDSVSA